MPLTLVTIACLSDNYAYLVHDAGSGATAVVDVPDAGPVQAALEERGWALTDILLTHHHHDHVGGVETLRAATGAAVWGAAQDAHRLPPLDRPVEPGRDERFGDDTVRVIDVPGHTVGHIAYFMAPSNLLFSGDSLMALGCGRLFEGTPEQMWGSLGAMADLPEDTIVCSGHEYTKANAAFALSLGDVPDALRRRAEEVTAARAKGLATVPTRLGLEKATNPFLRASDPALKAALGMENASDVDVFARTRALKDAF
ncbi:hydroxyacylglutathione hydrolase [Meridianimarinicoccus roseus]|uniref:Hydroxyacylglutathione hydrolase n=1 Tax=Meridianimarinicoccus roseus TaxID=2072018 RepID=A0A2V2L6B3_9RHOB|nr:hydroxyacylglutathione hydrolase [Meridianimarinicoccus roseus]PWR00850.1 hydroxyacylglutathione hydrolase [Meridianimarinicoccus roseus]